MPKKHAPYVKRLRQKTFDSVSRSFVNSKTKRQIYKRPAELEMEQLASKPSAIKEQRLNCVGHCKHATKATGETGATGVIKTSIKTRDVCMACSVPPVTRAQAIKDFADDCMNAAVSASNTSDSRFQQCQ